MLHDVAACHYAHVPPPTGIRYLRPRQSDGICQRAIHWRQLNNSLFSILFPRNPLARNSAPCFRQTSSSQGFFAGLHGRGRQPAETSMTAIAKSIAGSVRQHRRRSRHHLSPTTRTFQGVERLPAFADLAVAIPRSCCHTATGAA